MTLFIIEIGFNLVETLIWATCNCSGSQIQQADMYKWRIISQVRYIDPMNYMNRLINGANRFFLLIQILNNNTKNWFIARSLNFDNRQTYKYECNSILLIKSVPFLPFYPYKYTIGIMDSCWWRPSKAVGRWGEMSRVRTPVVVLTRIWVSFAISIRSLHRASRLDYPWPTPEGGNGPFQGRRTTDMRIVIIDSSSSVDSPSVAFLLHLLLPFLPLCCFLTTLQSGSALSAPGR